MSSVPMVSPEIYRMGVAGAVLGAGALVIAVHWVSSVFTRWAHAPKTVDGEVPQPKIVYVHSGGMYAGVLCFVLGLLVLMRYLAIVPTLLSGLHH